MKLHNFKNILPGAVLLLIAGLTSCTKDLDVTPIDPNQTMVPSEPELFAKCYATMALSGNWGGDSGDCDIDRLDGGTTGFVRQMWNSNELTTDEAICAWGDPGIPEFNYCTWGSAHPMLEGFYNRLYTSIAFCNHYLDVCGGKNEVRTAEVRFLRAMYYYFLMDCFGNVPFATQLMATSPEQIERAKLFEWIESELLAVKDEMDDPVVRTSSSDGYGRADRDAANLLLARMYLNAEVYTGEARWSDAKKYAEEVINGPHKLWDQYSDNGMWTPYQMLFMGDNGENGSSIEAILPLLGDGIKTTSYGTSMFLMSSAWNEDMDVNDDFGMVGKFWAGNRARHQLILKFFPNDDAPEASINDMYVAAGDDRALFHGIDRTVAVETPGTFASGFSVGKFRNTYSTGATPRSTAFPDADYFLMRSAEAYLIAAEADAHMNNGVTTDCAKYINALRDRAHKAQKLNSYNLDQILDERSRELYWEGFRRTDLIRYGYFGGDKSGQYLWEWKSGSQNGAGIPAYRNLFAIPASDMTANPNLKQNPNY